MRTTLTLLALLVLGACDDKSGTDGVDTDTDGGADTDTVVDTDGGDTDGGGDTDTDLPGPTGSTDVENPAVIAVGDVGHGTLTRTADPNSGTDFWSFTATGAGTYRATVAATADVDVHLTYCEGGATASGCLCPLDADPPQCCDATAGDACGIDLPLDAAEDVDLIVYVFGGSGTYTLEVTGPE